jgi:hypothetical protein
MADTEKITSNGKVYAIIVRAGAKVEGLEFFTPEDYPFQLGVHSRAAGVELKPHVHTFKPKTINVAQEMLHVCKGRIEVKFYDDNKKHFATATLSAGDTVLFAAGGHGIKFLEETKIIEVKQGPYENRENDKEMI